MEGRCYYQVGAYVLQMYKLKTLFGNIVCSRWDDRTLIFLIIQIYNSFAVSIKVPGSDDFPHDLTVGPAPTVMTGVENRLLAVYIGTTPSSGAVGGIDMYVLSSEAFKEELQVLMVGHAITYAIICTIFLGFITMLFFSCHGRERA